MGINHDLQMLCNMQNMTKLISIRASSVDIIKISFIKTYVYYKYRCQYKSVFLKVSLENEVSYHINSTSSV